MEVIFRANLSGYVAGIKHVSDHKVFDNYPTEQELKEYFNDFKLRFNNPGIMFTVDQFHFEIIIEKVFIPKIE